MRGIDTNVLVRFLVTDDEHQSALARAHMASLTAAEPGFIATVTLVEAYWVLRNAMGVDRAAVLDAFARLAAAAEVRVEDGEQVRFAIDAAREGADFADALIAFAARRAGCSDVVTFDERAVRRLGFTALDAGA